MKQKIECFMIWYQGSTTQQKRKLILDLKIKQWKNKQRKDRKTLYNQSLLNLSCIKDLKNASYN